MSGDDSSGYGVIDGSGSGSGYGDLNGDGITNALDLAVMLGGWGVCQ